MTDEMSCELQNGPVPGWLGEMTALHGRYYAAAWSFPLSFEAKVAREAADFLSRYDATRDLIVSFRTAAGVRATVTLDGSDPALPSGLAHLRWFIVSDGARGSGLGGQLMTLGVAFARSAGFRSIYLTTFRELQAAAGLYRRTGFFVTHESVGHSWGRQVTEQRLELQL